MDSTVRLAVVDDTDSRIQYSSGWAFTTHGSEENTEEFGPSVNHTSHDLTSGSGSLSFEFNGTYVQALGIVDTTNGKKAPTWSCSIDGKAIPVGLSDSTDTNLYHSNDNLCEAQDLASGTHVLTLNVTAPPLSPYLFGLDCIAYQPVQFVPEDTDILYVPHTDNNISTSGDDAWLIDPNSVSTSTVGAQLVFTFTGVGVQALGQSNANDVANPKGATYAIDAGTAIPFDIPTSDNFLYNVDLFDVRNLSLQTHTVTITFTGDTDKAALALEYFFVYNNPSSIDSTNAGNTTTQAGPPSSTNTAGAAKGSTPTGAIVGGIVAALVVLLILVAFFLLRRRKAKSKSDFRSEYYARTPTNLAVSVESGLVSPNYATSPDNSWTPTTEVRSVGPGTALISGVRSNANPAEPGSPMRSTKEQPSGLTVLRWEGEQDDGMRAMDSGTRIRESQMLPPLYTET